MTQRTPKSGVIAARQNSTLVMLLILAAALPYLNGLLNGFVYDDQTQILNNPYILNFSHLRQIFTSSAWSYLGKAGVTNYYRPVMTAGYLFCYQVFGKVAFGYHLVNLALDIAVVAVLFYLALAILGRRHVAFLAALIFALLPVHSESVDWIAGVTDLEVTLFCLVAFYCFVRAARPGGGRSPYWILGMSASFSLGLLSKEQALMLPLLATIFEHHCRKDESTFPQKVGRYYLLWLLAAAYVAARVRALGAFAPVVYKSRVPWRKAIFSAPALAGHYLWKLAWPWRLCAFYNFHPVQHIFDPRLIGGAASLLAILAAFVWLWKRSRSAAFGLIWFVATLIPVLNARWLAANVFAERYLYLPTTGLCWAISFAAFYYWDRRKARGASPIWRRSWAVCGAVLLFFFAVRIYLRNRDWRDDVRLYQRTLAQQPGAAPILNNLGTVYWARGDADQAAIEWILALRADPKLVPAMENLGLYYSNKGNYGAAAEEFERGLRLNPGYAPAHLSLGLAYSKMGDTVRAERQIFAATTLSPLNAEAHRELGKLYLNLGQVSAAEEQFRESVDCAPNYESLDQLGDIYLRAGRLVDAGREFEQSLALNRYDSAAHFSLGAIAQKTGRNDVAEREIRAGLETDPKNKKALDELAKLQDNRNSKR